MGGAGTRNMQGRTYAFPTLNTLNAEFRTPTSAHSKEGECFCLRSGGVFAPTELSGGSGPLFQPTGQQHDVAAHRRDMDEEDAVAVQHVVEAPAVRVGKSFRPGREQVSQLFNDVLRILLQILDGQIPVKMKPHVLPRFHPPRIRFMLTYTMRAAKMFQAEVCLRGRGPQFPARVCNPPPEPCFTTLDGPALKRS